MENLPNSGGLPKSLYRYRPSTEFLFSEIATNSVFFCPLNKLNDPLEGIFDFAASDVHDLRTALIELARADGEADYERRIQELSVRELQSIEKNAMRVAHEYISAFDNTDTPRWGVVCFTERLNNETMWNRYADQGRGAVLEFDLSQVQIPPGAFWKVNYTQERGAISVVKALSSRFDGEFFEALTYKTERWSCEEEWRILLDNPRSVSIRIPIARVIIGPRMSAEHKNRTVNAMIQNGIPRLAELVAIPDSEKLILQDRLYGSQEIVLC